MATPALLRSKLEHAFPADKQVVDFLLNSAEGTLDALSIGGTAVTSTAAELNILDGVTATAAELNRATDKSASVITTTATTLSVTVTEHGSRTIVTNCATTQTISLPAAAGTGENFTIVVGTASTDGNKVIAANGTDVIKGEAIISAPSTDAAVCMGFATSATSDKITFNQTTQGGGVGTAVELIDIAANTWYAKVVGSASTNTGTTATPFSAT